MLVIIDYGMGNLRSILNKLQRLGADARISSSIADLEEADRLILPGVGHFKAGMDNIRARNLLDPLNKKVLKEGTPILGICLGMQLFSRHSEEGNATGLGWLDAETVKFPLGDLKIPHMGWNTLENRSPCILFSALPADAEFYFVHSYYVKPSPSSNARASTTTYGISFTSAVCQKNIYGTQFHPEKSHQSGMTILRNFLEKA